MYKTEQVARLANRNHGRFLRARHECFLKTERVVLAECPRIGIALGRTGATSHNLNRTLGVLRDGLGNAAQQEPFEPCPSQRTQND